MRTIPLSSSILVFWQQLVYTEAALLAADDTKALAGLVTPVLDDFSAMLQKDLDTRRAVIQASARAFVADSAIDDAIRRLFSAVLALVQQNRGAQPFTALFSSHIGDYVRHALRKQIEVAKDLTDKLGLKIYSDEFKTPQIKALNAVIKRGTAVIEDVRKAETTRVEGRIDIRTWKEEANAARLTVYGQLLTLAAKSGRGKAWAEGFFPRSTGSPADAEEETPEPDATPAAEPAVEQPG